MTPNILQRLTTLCNQASTPHAVAAAGILRKLATDDSPVEKAAACYGHLKKLSEDAQDLVVGCVERVINTV